MNERFQFALDQIREVRAYTLPLIDDVPQDEWFRMPVEGVTHIAWQVGHIAMAQFRLCLERLRDLQPGDRDLISKDFIRLFNKGTIPAADASVYPPAAEIRATFDRVYESVMREAPAYVGNDLETPLSNPHPLFKTKLEALLVSFRHEMLHAGQIGLLRRLLGKAPLR